SAGWRTREADALAEHERLGGEIEAAKRAGETIGGELAGHAERVAALETALREAQEKSSTQRGAVTEVQQQIQVSAAEARGVDERWTQAEARRDRLAGEEKSLVAIAPGELESAQRSADAAAARHNAALAVVADWQARIPALDDERRTLQERVNDEARRHAEL